MYFKRKNTTVNCYNNTFLKSAQVKAEKNHQISLKLLKFAEI